MSMSITGVACLALAQAQSAHRRFSTICAAIIESDEIGANPSHTAAQLPEAAGEVARDCAGNDCSIV